MKEKSREMRATLKEDLFSAAGGKNILAMTFRQVVVHRVLSFKLEIFAAGSQRDMEDLSNPREVVNDHSFIAFSFIV